MGHGWSKTTLLVLCRHLPKLSPTIRPHVYFSSELTKFNFRRHKDYSVIIQATEEHKEGGWGSEIFVIALTQDLNPSLSRMPWSPKTIKRLSFLSTSSLCKLCNCLVRSVCLLSMSAWFCLNDHSIAKRIRFLFHHGYHR